MLGFLQQHTIAIYKLDQHTFVKKRIKARELLSADRFDLYAKLFYIKNRVQDAAKAQQVYADHILAFNPDGKEPGRSDKDGVGDFTRVFDELINHFKDHEFDETISLIPVDENYVPLDGSHRVAALAYFDKEIEVLYFPDVKSKTSFDYNYFMTRGLPIKSADAIAKETLAYASNLHLACLWSKKSNIQGKQSVISCIKNQFPVYYVKNMHIPLKYFNRMVTATGHQKMTDYMPKESSSSISAFNGVVQLILFQSNNKEEFNNMRESIEKCYKLNQYGLYITDNYRETEMMMDLVFTEKSKQFQNTLNRTYDKIEAFRGKFKNVYWINFKVKAAKLLKRLKRN